MSFDLPKFCPKQVVARESKTDNVDNVENVTNVEPRNVKFTQRKKPRSVSVDQSLVITNHLLVNE